MKYLIKFRPELEEDILSAYRWYENKAEGLGEDFLRVLYSGISEIQRHPNISKKIYHDFRRKLLR